MIKPRVEGLYITSNEGEPMRSVISVFAIEGVGLRYDRYAGNRGIFSRSGRKVIRHVTLIEYESIAKTGFTPEETRRNIVVRYFPLSNLADREFMVGDVKIKGVEICDPCRIPSDLCGKEGFASLPKHAGGLRAEILSSGYIFVSDNLRVLPPTD